MKKMTKRGVKKGSERGTYGLDIFDNPIYTKCILFRTQKSFEYVRLMSKQNKNSIKSYMDNNQVIEEIKKEGISENIWYKCNDKLRKKYFIHSLDSFKKMPTWSYRQRKFYGWKWENLFSYIFDLMLNDMKEVKTRLEVADPNEYEFKERIKRLDLFIKWLNVSKKYIITNKNARNWLITVLINYFKELYNSKLNLNIITFNQVLRNLLLSWGKEGRFDKFERFMAPNTKYKYTITKELEKRWVLLIMEYYEYYTETPESLILSRPAFDIDEYDDEEYKENQKYLNSKEYKKKQEEEAI